MKQSSEKVHCIIFTRRENSTLIFFFKLEKTQGIRKT